MSINFRQIAMRVGLLNSAASSRLGRGGQAILGQGRPNISPMDGLRGLDIPSLRKGIAARVIMCGLLAVTGITLTTTCAFATQDTTPASQMVATQPHYDHAVWNGMPISFVVPVGQERVLRFPGRVVLHNRNPALTTSKVRILNNDGFLYIKAKQAFAPIRIPIELEKSSKVILVDLSAQPNTVDTPVSVVVPGAPTKQASTHPKKPPQIITYVTMMRYAIQHLYAPERLLKVSNVIHRTPMYTSRSVNLFNNNDVMAMPLISWRGGNLYVTAVLLKNTWHQRLVLDPRNLNGNWLAASFYPTNFVTPMGSAHDRTTLFVLSDRPFNAALSQVRGYR